MKHVVEDGRLPLLHTLTEMPPLYVEVRPGIVIKVTIDRLLEVYDVVEEGQTLITDLYDGSREFELHPRED